MIIRHFIIIVGSHTLWTNAAVQSGNEVVEKANELLVCPQMILWYGIENVSQVITLHRLFLRSFFDGTLWLTL